MLYVVDVSNKEIKNIKSEVSVLQDELKQFEPELAAKPCIYAFNKIDQLGDKKDQVEKELAKAYGEKNSFFISASQGLGLKQLSEAIHKLCATKKPEEEQMKLEPYDGTNMPGEKDPNALTSKLNKTLPFLQ